MYSFLDAKPNAKYKPKAVVGEKRECPAPDNELECLRKRVQDLEADNRRLLSIAEKLVDLFARE